MTRTMTRRRALAASIAVPAGLSLARVSATPVAFPIAEAAVYIGHGARVMTHMPASWKPFGFLADGYVGDDGMIGSMPAKGSSFAEAAAYLKMGALLNIDPATLKDATIAGVPAVTAEHVPYQMLGTEVSVAILTYPEPFTAFGETYTYAAVITDPVHYADVIAHISLDMSAVTPRQYLLSLLDMMQASSIVTEKVDWDALRAGIDGAVTDMDSAHVYIKDVIRPAMKAAGDKHSFFDRDSAPNSTPAATPAGGPEIPTGSMLNETIGYIRIPECEAGPQPAFIEAGRKVLKSQVDAGACAWVVELRGNFGGNMWPMIAALHPLLGDGKLFGFAYPGQPPYVQTGAQVMANAASDTPFTEPGDLSQAPVAVLMGGDTASSGEMTAISFIGRDHTTSFGSLSAGYTTSNESRPLLDGWVLLLATSQMTDRNGKSYSGELKPDVPTVGENKTASDDPKDATVAAAMDWLGEQPCVAPKASPAASPKA